MSLSADSEIRSLAVKAIKAKADKLEIPISRLHRNYGAFQINIIFQMILKLFYAGGFETERRSVRNGDFSFRR